MYVGRRKCVIGLIGGIGSGKSRVAEELARHGGTVIVADQLGHQALRQPDIRQRLINRWGLEICDATGEIDRGKVAAIVFADTAERKALEAEVFPFIESGLEEQIDQARRDPRTGFIVLDAAILLEAGWSKVCDRIIYVHAPRAQRLERLARHRGWNEKEARQRSRAQLPLSEKVAHAHLVVDNSGSLRNLASQIDQLLTGPELIACIDWKPLT